MTDIDQLIRFDSDEEGLFLKEEEFISKADSESPKSESPKSVQKPIIQKLDSNSNLLEGSQDENALKEPIKEFNETKFNQDKRIKFSDKRSWRFTKRIGDECKNIFTK